MRLLLASLVLAVPFSCHRQSKAAAPAVGVGLGPGHGLLPQPRQGPIVTWRPLARAEVPALSDLSFSLGDLELF